MTIKTNPNKQKNDYDCRRIIKLHNSAIITLPARFLVALGWQTRDYVRVQKIGKGLVITALHKAAPKGGIK